MRYSTDKMYVFGKMQQVGYCSIALTKFVETRDKELKHCLSLFRYVISYFKIVTVLNINKFMHTS